MTHLLLITLHGTAKYWWRVRRGEGEWSRAVAFEVWVPEHAFTIRAGSDAATVARVLRDAAAHCPAGVDFEPGEYRLAPMETKSHVTLAKAHDLIIENDTKNHETHPDTRPHPAIGATVSRS